VPSPALLLFLLPLGLFLLACGLGMYTNRWPILLAAEGFLPGKPGLAATYIGLWMIMTTFSPLWLSSELPVLAGALSLLSFACMVIGVAGCFWMPRFLQPAWVRELDDKAKRSEDAYSIYKRQRNGQAPAPEERQ
jgi:hypothetical protein